MRESMRRGEFLVKLKSGNLFEIGRQYDLDFQISEQMVKKFSELTGDRNSLHVDVDFGRRSIYRRNVVHGLLTVAHLLSLGLFRADSVRFSILKISASFLKPVFLNEPLSLSVQIKKWCEEDRQIELEYIIKKTKSQSVVTNGYLILSYSDAKRKPSKEYPLEGSSKAKMVTTPLEESDLEFDRIEQNQEKSFSFKISRHCANALFDILSADVNKNTL